MPHSAEGLAFLTRLSTLPGKPGVDLDPVLKPSLDDEHELRKLFAQDKTNSRLDNPHVGLVDVFGPGTDAIRETRARVVDDTSEDSLSGKYIMPLKGNQRRKDGEASMVADLDEFRRNWSIFTEGSLSQLFDWSNVIAAGGAVLSALLPLPEESKKSKRAIRKYYHSTAFPSSDVDLFLWGLTPEQAEKKIVAIYEAVRDSVPWDVTCIRTKHTVSIHSQYPYRSVQIVLRLYRSPAEVLAGFDIDAPCCAYDGEHVWANPRAITAMMRQCNTIDVTRRSPSYEVRLAKYAKRGFEVYVPNLRRKDVDPTIYERSIAKIEGLARLLVLEKLHNADERYQFLESRRRLRGRPFALRRPGNKKKRKYKGDLKADTGGLEMNDYDVASLHIPYGPGWDARRIEKLVYQTDLGMNSTFNPKNKGRRLHRHPAFFGTVEECMEDCCEHCPEPIDEDEHTLQRKEDENYIRGRISFIQENPGRQTLSGSFNPIDEGEWSEQVYIRPIQKLFHAIAAHDLNLVKTLLEENKTNHTIDLRNRDHVGRTALHLAVLVKDEEIARVLIDEGCRMIARLVDGRTALHLAAQYGMDGLIEKMFEKSKLNKEEAEKKEREKGKVKEDEDRDEKTKDEAGPSDTSTDVERPSSEDDWSSDENDGNVEAVPMDVDDDQGEDSDYDHCDDDGDSKKKAKEPQPDGEVPEDEEDEPDVLDVNLGDWDQGFTPLCYAVLYSTRSTVGLLLKNGADPNQAAVPSSTGWESKKNLLPLFLTLVRSDEDVGADIAERLIEGGATASTADMNLVTNLHHAVLAKKVKILDVFLRKDPGAKKALDFPSANYGTIRFPVVSAVARRGYATLLTLLAYGAKINPTGADVTRAKLASGKSESRLWGYGNTEDYGWMIYRPVETALANGDYIIDVLLELDAEFNVGTLQSQGRYHAERRTILDWVVDALQTDLPRRIDDVTKECEDLEKKLEKKTYSPPENIKTWKEYYDDFFERYTIAENGLGMENKERQREEKKRALESIESTKEYLQHVRSALEAMGAKTWEELNPVSEDPKKGRVPTRTTRSYMPAVTDTKEEPKPKYMFLSKNRHNNLVQLDLSERYDELFEAAFKGDDAKIEKLCVPGPGSEAVPVQITVQALKPNDRRTRTGLTPLYAAIAGKKWNTAKFIMGIAAAQYHNEDDDDKEALQSALFDLVDEEDDVHMSDCDSDYSDDVHMSGCDSDYSDETIDPRKRQEKFVDIAKRISVRTDIHPSMLLNLPVSYSLNNGMKHSTLVVKVIQENDFEAFVHLLNIQYSISTEQNNQRDLILDSILHADNPKFLDELIRRTGVGIDTNSVRQTSGEDHPIALNDKNRLYLGLNIHGKKRADLARKGDPNASNQDEKSIPLVWRAAGASAKSAIEYLASEKPLAAYKYFATHGESDTAEWLRHSKTLESSLSEWLGWNISSLGESPLSTAVLRNAKDVLPALFAKAPKLMGSALHAKIKFLGFNLLLLAAARGSDKDIFDFLLKKGVSPLENDTERGRNMYHFICSSKNGELLEYLLERLPRDVSEELLAQRSKKKLNTPLQIAVKLGSIRLVKAILAFTQDGLLVYDAHGFTPLHNALRCGFKVIADEILKVIPQEGLYLENGVGKTPYEDTEKYAMRLITHSVSEQEPSPLMNVNTVNALLNVEELGKEVQSVIETLKRLINNGILEKDSELANVFEKFVSATEGRLAEAKAKAKAVEEAEVEEKRRNENPVDNSALIETFVAIATAVKGNEAKRSLIHLKDVQLSVATDLNTINHEKVAQTGDGLEEEEDEETQEKRKGLVFSEMSLRFSEW